MIFQQPEHLICTKQYSYHSLNKPGEIYTHGFHFYGKQQDFIPLENRKLPQNVFSTNEWLLHTYYGVAGTFMIWNYGIYSDFSCTGKYLHSESGQISVKRDNIFELSVLNQILLSVERKSGVFLRSLATRIFQIAKIGMLTFLLTFS